MLTVASSLPIPLETAIICGAVVWLLLAVTVANYGRRKGFPFFPLFVCAVILSFPIVLLAVAIGAGPRRRLPDALAQRPGSQNPQVMTPKETPVIQKPHVVVVKEWPVIQNPQVLAPKERSATQNPQVGALTGRPVTRRSRRPGAKRSGRDTPAANQPPQEAGNG